MRTPVKVAIVAAVVALAVAGAGLWWFFRDDAPPPVALDTAVESVTTTETTAAEPTGIEGTWTVDRDSGEFDFETATGTFAGFRIQEELASIGSATAVGRTGDVTGSITILGTTVTDATFEVDLRTITTNDSRRNDRVQQALETGQFPTATFALTAPIELGERAGDGEPVTVTAAGDLTLHGVTNAVELAIEAQLVGGTVVVVGSTVITFADYAVEPPSAPIVLSVEDHGILELQLLLTRSAG
ncbi:MAG TPA: YceI family protein [Acidimicrobiales bacterium]|nr:YceI family protein [Acidimicrobiales bacterium]